jgi:hypothetical protein
MLKYLILLTVLIVGSTSITAQDATATVDRDNYKVRAVAELGFLGVASHKVQFGNAGTYFDYRADGGQSILFAVSRLSLELDVKDKHTWILLYQPLVIDTEVSLREDVRVDDVVFPAGSNLDLSYGFPFYRLSYLRKIKTGNDRWRLALGGSLQIRNATIGFESPDGSLRRVNRDVGPVPLLKARTSWHQNDNASLEFEVDGIYAPISYLNGSDSEVTGALIDASLRQNITIADQVTAFLNLRYLAGGAVGTSSNPEPGTDGYTRNWLHFYTVTTGFTYAF